MRKDINLAANFGQNLLRFYEKSNYSHENAISDQINCVEFHEY